MCVFLIFASSTISRQQIVPGNEHKAPKRQLQSTARRELGHPAEHSSLSKNQRDSPLKAAAKSSAILSKGSQPKAPNLLSPVAGANSPPRKAEENSFPLSRHTAGSHSARSRYYHRLCRFRNSPPLPRLYLWPRFVLKRDAKLAIMDV